MMSNDEFNIFRNFTALTANGGLEDDFRVVVNKPCILVVDDDSTVRESLELTFRKYYNVISCSSGSEAIEKIDSDIYAIILDIRMPDMDGFTVFRELKIREPYVPILFYSAYQDLKDPYDIMNEFRPFGYVMKGTGYHHLMDSVRSAVNYYNSIRQTMRISEELRQVNEDLEDRIKQRTQTILKQKNQLEHQIELARKIQQSLLPATLPDIPSMQLAYVYQPISGVGGDFVDVFYKDGEGVGVFICDVSGHGVPAAFVAAMVKMSLRNWEDYLHDPASLLKWIRESLSDKIENNFLTAIAGHFNTRTGEFVWSTAGHPKPLLLSADGSMEYLQCKGTAIMEYLECECINYRHMISPGDTVVLYTDGVGEFVCENGQLPESDQFLSLFEGAYESPDELCRGILSNIEKLTGGNPDSRIDDLTILAFKYRGE